LFPAGIEVVILTLSVVEGEEPPHLFLLSHLPLVFLLLPVILPRGGRTCFASPLFFFFKNSPKIACQAPKPSNSLKQKEIELAG
jgi:hypothetical protein